jgi:beta-lactamase class A
MRNRLLAMVILAVGSCLGQSVEALLWEKLEQRVVALDLQMDGVLGVAVIDLKTGKRWGYHADTVFAQASLIKVPILIEVFRLKELGQLRFEEKVTIDPKILVGGSGVLQDRLKNGPLTVPVEEIVREMIASSDNTATNWLIQRVGMANVNKTMRELGFAETKLQRIMIDSAAALRNEENISTPNEMAAIFERIHRGNVLTPASRDGMLAYLRMVGGGMKKGLPDGVDLASKTGELEGVRTQTGIVYLKERPFVLSVMSAYLTEPNSPVEAVTRLVYQTMQKIAQGNAYGNLGVR